MGGAKGRGGIMEADNPRVNEMQKQRVTMFSIVEERFFVWIFVAMAVFAGLYIYNDRVTTNYIYSKDTQMRMAVIKTLGGPAIPVIAQCCTSRNIAEGIYARRSEIPGGFCFHSDCDVVSVPDVFCEKVYSLKVLRGAALKESP